MPNTRSRNNVVPLPGPSQEVRAEVVQMTPERARELLDQNHDNRRLSPEAVAKLARDLRDGNFRFNGDAIRVRADGVLADGQHRLAACVEAGVPFQTLLVTGLGRDDVLTLDRGRKRSIGDNLTIAYGYPSGTQLAAACRLLAVLATGAYRTSITAKEAADILEAHPGLVDSNRAMRVVKPASHAGVCAIHYIGTHIQGDPDRADAFVKVFRTGVPDYDWCPAHLFREELWIDRTRRTRMAPRQHLATLTYVWAKFRRREMVKALRPWDALTMEGWNEAVLKRPAPGR
jgi:hypothetical protein